MADKQIDFLTFAEKTVRGAGEILMSFKNSCEVKKTKDILSLDVATNADYASEKYIIAHIQANFPQHSIYSEETDNLGKQSDYEWIIDPLDGTKEYIRHVPYYYVLLALEHKNRLIAGLGYQPEIGRLFSCTEDSAMLNGHKIAVSKQGELTKSLINVRLPTNRWDSQDNDTYFNMLKKLTYQVYRLRSTEWDVEAMFHVALGAVEGYILPPSRNKVGPKWYDVASGMLMVRAAGGMVTDFQGKPIIDRDLSRGIVATNGLVHPHLLALLKANYLA